MERYIEHRNQDTQPFRWTKTAGYPLDKADYKLFINTEHQRQAWPQLSSSPTLGSSYQWHHFSARRTSGPFVTLRHLVPLIPKTANEISGCTAPEQGARSHTSICTTTTFIQTIKRPLVNVCRIVYIYVYTA